MTTLDLHAEGTRLIAKWQPRLRLMDWDIRMQIGPCDPDHGAESTILWRDRMAAVRVPSDFPAGIRADMGQAWETVPDVDLLEDCIVHELLHVVEFPQVQLVSDEVEWLAGKPDGCLMGAPLRAGWKEYREWWINHLVRVLTAADRGKWPA